MGCSESSEVYPLTRNGSAPNFGGSRSVVRKGAAKRIKIPLTEREIYSITKSWKTISINMINTGKSMFLK